MTHAVNSQHHMPRLIIKNEKIVVKMNKIKKSMFILVILGYRVGHNSKINPVSIQVEFQIAWGTMQILFPLKVSIEMLS